MFSPCGMIVDYLHDFYTMPIWLYIGGVKTQLHVRWYKAPAGAKVLPFGSCIFSHVWDNNPGESIAGEVGEIGYPRTWDPGANPGYQGQCYRGDPTWFATGELPPLATIAPSPCACQIPPAAASGGLVLGGSAVASTSVCQRKVTPTVIVFVDLHDGNGPQQWHFARTIGAFACYTQTGTIPVLGFADAVGVPSAGFCITVGAAAFISQPPPGHFQYTQTGALRYLLSAYHAVWDWFNDGTLIADVYTIHP